MLSPMSGSTPCTTMIGLTPSRIEALAENPRPEGCVKLSTLERYRSRQGVYRIVYEIRDKELIVQVVKVAHRRDVYEGG